MSHVPANGEAPPDWTALLAEAEASQPAPIPGRRHDGGIPTATRPQKVFCGEKEELYAVKFAQNTHGDGRGIFTEQLVARLGQLLSAPVPEVALVEVSVELNDVIRASPASQFNFEPQPGVHHGSRWALGYSDRQQLAYVDENRQAFAALHVLAVWVFCNGDHQWIYRNDPPHEVLSVDHSMFFPNGPEWTVEGLAQAAGNVTPDQQFDSVGLGSDDYEEALGSLAELTADQIAHVVAAPPDDWGVGVTDREAIASFLWARRPSVAGALGA